jgi:hypothetical protein
VQNAIPAFSWSASANASTYEVWVADTTAGQSPAFDQMVTGTTWTPAAPLTVGDSYVWWVRGISGNQVSGAWCTGTTVTVQPLNTPTGLVPSGPGQGTTPTFSWGTVAAADYYEVWVDDTTTGKSQVLYNANVASTSWAPAATLTSGHSYRWWARAHSNNGDYSSWRQAATFSVS